MKCDTVKQIGTQHVDRHGAPVQVNICAYCTQRFWTHRKHAKTCSAACRQRLSRATRS